MNYGLLRDHRYPITGLDWIKELTPQATDQLDATGLLVGISDKLQQLAIMAQERESLSATQIRLLILFDDHQEGLTPTVAAPMLARSVPVVIEARNILLQRALVEKVRIPQMCRYTYKITPDGRETLSRLNNWCRCLKLRLALLDKNEMMDLTSSIRKIVVDL